MAIFCFVALLIGFSTSGWSAGANQPKVDPEKRHLETTMTTRGVTFILKISNGQVETDSFGSLKSSDSDMLRDLSFYSSRRLPATIAFDRQSGRIASVSSAPTDVIVALSPKAPSEQQVAVQLTMRPSVLYLHKSNPRFDQLYDLLKEALASKRRVHLGVLAGDDVIEDVRIEATKP
jgi:hypothetical protein